MNTKKWTLWLAMMGVLFATAFANDPIDGDDGLRNGRTERIIEKIAPVMDAQRAKLDAKMSDDDVTKVESLKKQLKDQRLMLHELNCEAGAARIKGEKPAESLRQEIRAQMTVIGNLYEDAEDIADKYEDAIEGLMEEVKAELQSMRGDGEKEFQGRRPGGNRNFNGRSPHGGRFGQAAPEVRFLLWDGVNI